MSYSTVTYLGNGANTLFAVPFPYLNQSDINVQVNGANVAFGWSSPTTVSITPAPANGVTVYIYRSTNIATLPATFADGSMMRAADLNSDFQAVQYLTQDAWDQTQQYISLARQQTGLLPVVTVAANNDLLGVVNGVWAPITPAQVETILGLGTAAYVNTGTAGATIPLNSSLGGLAYIGIAANAGLVNSSGLTVQLADTSLQLAAGGLSVKYDSTVNAGLAVNARGLTLNLAANSGLAVGTGGLSWNNAPSLSADPGAPSGGMMWYHNTLGGLHYYTNTSTAHASVACIGRTSGDSSTIANTAAMTAANVGWQIPANLLTAGKIIRFRGAGFYACATGSTTLQINLGLDGTGTLMDGIAFNCASTGRFVVEGTITCRTTGAGGTVQLSTQFSIESLAYGQGGTENSSISYNTTATHTVFPCFQFSVANAGNTVVVRSLITEVIDP